MLTVKEQIIKDLEKIHEFVGVRAEVSCDDLVEAARGDDKNACVRLAVKKMNLQTNINVHELPLKPGEPLGNIILPDRVPFFGTNDWNRFSFEMTIRTDPQGYTSPHRYLLIVLHELAHVLMKGIAPEYCCNERFIDLTVLALGFCEIALRGRTQGINKAGYLSDSEFYAAIEYLGGIQTPFAPVKAKIQALGADIQAANELIEQCRQRLDKIYQYKPAMDFGCAAKISMLCGCSGLQQLALDIDSLKNRSDMIEKWVFSAPSTPAAQFEAQIKPLNELRRKISNIRDMLKTDASFLKKLEPGILTKLLMDLRRSFKRLLPHAAGTRQ